MISWRTCNPSNAPVVKSSPVTGLTNPRFEQPLAWQVLTEQAGSKAVDLWEAAGGNGSGNPVDFLEQFAR
jgi:hypothetical protein